MPKQQTEFTDTEAGAVCEMIALLAKEGYEIAIIQGKTKVDEEGEKFFPYIVTVNQPGWTGEPVAQSTPCYFLIDAMTDAFQSTPEKKC